MKGVYMDSGPYEVGGFDCLLDRHDERYRGTAARSDFVRPQEQDHAGVGLGKHNRCPIARCGQHRFRLIVAVKRLERHGEPRATFLPSAAFSQKSVRDVAQGAMGSSEPSVDPVRDLAERRPVSRVDTDEPIDHRCAIRRQDASFADFS